MWQRFITFQLDRRWCQSQSSRRSRRNFLHIREAVWALWRSVTDPHFTSTCKMRPKAICVSWWTCRTIMMSCFFRGRDASVWHDSPESGTKGKDRCRCRFRTLGSPCQAGSGFAAGNLDIRGSIRRGRKLHEAAVFSEFGQAMRLRSRHAQQHDWGNDVSQAAGRKGKRRCGWHVVKHSCPKI